jgi:hypothetical protein
VVAVLAVGDAESMFFRRSGRSAGMSVAVYLRTRGLSASARSPVPALFFRVKKVREGMASVRRGFQLRARTRVQGYALDGGFRSRIGYVRSALGNAAVVVLTTGIRR